MGAQGAHFEKGWRRVTALLWIWHTFICNPELLDLAKKGMGDVFFTLSRLYAVASPHFEKPLDSIDAVRLFAMKQASTCGAADCKVFQHQRERRMVLGMDTERALKEWEKSRSIGRRV